MHLILILKCNRCGRLMQHCLLHNLWQSFFFVAWCHVIRHCTIFIATVVDKGILYILQRDRLELALFEHWKAKKYTAKEIQSSKYYQENWLPMCSHIELEHYMYIITNQVFVWNLKQWTSFNVRLGTLLLAKVGRSFQSVVCCLRVIKLRNNFHLVS